MKPQYLKHSKLADILNPEVILKTKYAPKLQQTLSKENCQLLNNSPKQLKYSFPRSSQLYVTNSQSFSGDHWNQKKQFQKDISQKCQGLQSQLSSKSSKQFEINSSCPSFRKLSIQKGNYYKEQDILSVGLKTKAFEKFETTYYNDYSASSPMFRQIEYQLENQKMNQSKRLQQPKILQKLQDNISNEEKPKPEQIQKIKFPKINSTNHKQQQSSLLSEKQSQINTNQKQQQKKDAIYLSNYFQKFQQENSDYIRHIEKKCKCWVCTCGKCKCDYAKKNYITIMNALPSITEYKDEFTRNDKDEKILEAIQKYNELVNKSKELENKKQNKESIILTTTQMDDFKDESQKNETTQALKVEKADPTCPSFYKNSQYEVYYLNVLYNYLNYGSNTSNLLFNNKYQYHTFPEITLGHQAMTTYLKNYQPYQPEGSPKKLTKSKNPMDYSMLAFSGESQYSQIFQPIDIKENSPAWNPQLNSLMLYQIHQPGQFKTSYLNPAIVEQTSICPSLLFDQKAKSQIQLNEKQI